MKQVPKESQCGSYYVISYATVLLLTLKTEEWKMVMAGPKIFKISDYKPFVSPPPPPPQEDAKQRFFELIDIT